MTVTHWFKPYFIPQSSEEVLKILTVQQNATSNKAKRKESMRDRKSQKCGQEA